MKKLLSLVTLAAVTIGTLPVAAQSKLDLGSQARLRGTDCGLTIEDSRDGVKKINRKTVEAPATVRGFVTLAEGADISELESTEGVKVVRQRGRLVMVEIDRNSLGTLDKVSAVKRFTLERTLSPKMDKARAASGIDKIHSGTELPQAYTGKGVIAGIVDGGFDPNHINFKNEDGTSRITHFTYYRPTQSGSYVEEKYGADYIPNIDTEDETTYHGTHTTGIMAGGYRGKLDAAVRTNSFFGTVKEMDNPYYGVAYEADIAASAGALTDYYIALGCESILDYAYEEGKPAVINLSLGSNVGPHDGSSTICQYIDMASELDPVIFCVSAGNEGDLPISINKTFTEADNKIASFLYPAYQFTDYKNPRFGQTYFYSNDATQFEIQAVIVNTERNAVAFRMPLAATDGAMKYWVSGADYAADETDVVSLQFAKYLTGYVGIGAEFDENTGRYYGVLDVMCWDNVTGSNKDGKYILGFQVTGTAGQRVDVFNDGIYNNLSSYNLEGYDNGGCDGTISDVACGKNYVVVGSYNTRDDWASLDKGIYGYQNSFPAGKVSPFSSWGTLYDGRKLPTVCAPGAAIISSANEYYIEAESLNSSSIQAQLEADGRKYSWFQSVGTSMSTPVVAGSIALWLEADPTLNYADVLDIIRRTANVDADVIEAGHSVQWGAGKFDAYAGLKEVLKQASLNEVSADIKAPLIKALGDNRYEIYAPAESLDIRVTDLSGRTSAQISADGSETVADLSKLTAGMYILTVNSSYSTKIIIK